MRKPTVNQPPPLRAKEETLPELEELEATTAEKNGGARGTYSGGSTPGPKNDGAAATQIYTKACARKERGGTEGWRRSPWLQARGGKPLLGAACCCCCSSSSSFAFRSAAAAGITRARTKVGRVYIYLLG